MRVFSNCEKLATMKVERGQKMSLKNLNLSSWKKCEKSFLKYSLVEGQE